MSTAVSGAVTAAVTSAPRVRRFLLVRHGETEGQSSVRYHGSNDVPLSDLGRSQVRGLVPLLRAPLGATLTTSSALSSAAASAAPVLVLHSPLLRAAESAAILAQGCGWRTERLRSEPGFCELSFGDCEGLTAAEIAARHPEFWREHQAGRAEVFPGGEPFAVFRERVRAAFLQWCRELPAGDIVVVAHRGVVRQGLRFLLGTAAGMGDTFAVDLGSLSVVEGGPPDGALRQFNVAAPQAE